VRLFIAVWPPEDVLDLLARMSRPAARRLRWTSRQQWHVTLRFLGQVSDPESVVASLREVPERLRDRGEVEIDAVLGPATTWFGGRRILHVPVSGLDSVAAGVQVATERWAPVEASRPFTGHVTLARVQGHGTGPAQLAGMPIDARWRVGEVAVVSSTLDPSGARYRTVAAVELA
jgi:2'-5' RNA ligase